MEYGAMPIRIGEQFLLQCRAYFDRLPTKFVGLEQGRYLIVAVPSMSTADLKAAFVPGRSVVARYLHEGTALGFETEVVGAIIQPACLVFLKYPSDVKNLNLRKHKRRDCFFPAEVTLESRQVTGAVVDISAGGCCFTGKNMGKSAAASLAVEKSILLEFVLPGMEPKIKVVSTIRNIRDEPPLTMVGLQFFHISEEQKHKLQMFIDQMSLLDEEAQPSAASPPPSEPSNS